MNLVFAVFLRKKKLTKCSQNPGLVNQFSATLRGQLNWTGPIANGSDKCNFSTCEPPGLLQESFGGPECPGERPREYPRERGCPTECPTGCPWGHFFGHSGARGLNQPREAMDLISKIRSCTVRSDLKNKQKTAENALFLRSDLTVQDRILFLRSLASLGRGP